MAEQPLVNIFSQIGPEVTAGTSVAATHQFADFGLSDGIHINTYQNVAQGRLYAANSSRGKGWGELKPVGDAGFNGLAYPLSSLFGAATITTATGGTLSKQWKWTPVISGAAVGQTYTVERGPTSGQARKYAYVSFDNLKLSYTKDDITIDGHAWGREVTTGITITSLAASAVIPSIPLRGTDTIVYLDSTSAGLGTTQLTRIGALDITFGNFSNPWYGIDNTQTSYSALLPDKPAADLTFRVQNDTAGIALYENYVKTGNTAYMRISTVGPIADGTAHYTLTLDLALKLTAPQDYAADGPMEIIPYTAKVAEDTAWGTGQSMIITLINFISAL